MFLYAIAVIIAVFVYLIYKLTFWHRQNIPSCLSSIFLPICETTLHIQQYGKIIGTYEYLRPILLIRDAKLINDVLFNKSEIFCERNRCLRNGKAMGSCLLWSSSTDCKLHEKVIKNAFSRHNMLDMSKHFWKTNYEFTDIINQIISFEKFIDIKVFINMFSLKAYVNCCFGGVIDNKIKTKLIAEFEKLFQSKSDSTIGKWTSKLDQLLKVKSIDTRALTTIAEIAEYLFDNRKVDECKNCILFMLSDANKNSDGKDLLSKKQIIDNTILFAIMGYRTSMPTISHLIYNLATNQVIQQKLIKEIDETFDDKPKDRKKDKKVKEDENKVKVNEKSDEKKEENKEMDELEEEDGKGFLEAIDGMQYLDACIKETLRLYPPVPIIKRKATTDTKLGNICIPKNSEIWIPVSAVHRDPDYYSNAEVFKPERFLVKSRSKVIEGSYVAFGGDGARGCIAQSVALLEIKLCLISLLKNYRFAKCGLTKELQYESSNEMFASMTPTNVFVKIIKRSKGILE